MSYMNWVWGRSYGKVTDGIRDVIGQDRENHVVGLLGWCDFGWQVKAKKRLDDVKSGRCAVPATQP